METIARLERHLLPIAVDCVRIAARLLLLIVIFVPLERLFALRRQKVFRRGFAADLGFYFLNGLLPGLLLAAPMSAIAWALHFMAPDGMRAGVAALPVAIRYSAAMVVGEVGFYWGHRWSHQIPVLWRFHSVHHSAEQMDWLVNTRAHPVDLIFTRLCGFIPMYPLGLAQPMAQTLDFVPLLVILTATLWGFFIHANLNWRFGPLEWLIATPAFHHWHHTYEAPLNRNFSPMLPWVDRIFGTYHVPNSLWPRRYGTEAPFGSGLADQLIEPFLPGQG